MSTRVSVYFSEWSEDQYSSEQWLRPRKKIPVIYMTALNGIKAADQTLALFNTPVELLPTGMKGLIGDYRGRALAVGDVVRVDNDDKRQYFMCKKIGWQELSETPIPLEEFERYLQHENKN